MEDTGKYAFTADCAPEEPEKDTCNILPSESAFFSQMEKNLKKYAADMNAPKPLETLYDNIHYLNRLFIHLGRPWVADSGMIQKACMWYLAYAQPTKQEALKLTRTLNGFTSSASYISEWNVLISRMQEFLTTQEKELKRLFDYEKENERKHKEQEERLRAEGVAYCMVICEGEIYGMLYPQIEELYRTMGRFIEREKASKKGKSEGYDEYGVSISKNINLFADGDESHVSYNLSNLEFSICSISTGQRQEVIDTIQEFLQLSKENVEKKVRVDIKDKPGESQTDIAFEVKEDSRLPNCRTVPWISKRIRKEDDKETETDYFIDINGIHSPELSFSEFVAVYRKLGDFLGNQPESAAPARG